MNEIIEIIMKRDGMTESEARECVEAVMEMVNDWIEAGDFTNAEEIFVSELGLEPDYLINLLV